MNTFSRTRLFAVKPACNPDHLNFRFFRVFPGFLQAALQTQGKAIDASVHGDGNLAADGKSDIAAWLPIQAYGLRGSAFNGTAAAGRISDRTNDNIFTAVYGADNNSSAFGMRLTRTAP